MAMLTVENYQAVIYLPNGFLRGATNRDHQSSIISTKILKSVVQWSHPGASIIGSQRIATRTVDAVRAVDEALS
jgi:hypothetical protein